MMKNENEIKKNQELIQLNATRKIEFSKKAILLAYKNKEYNQSSIAIKILSILGGLISTIAFLGFLLSSGIYESKTGLLITGFIFIISAIGLNRYSDRLLLDTFSISIYVIGIFLTVFGLLELKIDENIIAIISIIIALFSLILTQNYIQSFLSIVLISASLLLVLVFLNKTYELIHVYNIIISVLMTYVFLEEAKLITINKKISKLYNPLRIGLVVSFLFSLAFFGAKKSHDIPIHFSWFFSIILFLLIVYIVSIIIKTLEIKNKKHKLLIYISSILILGLTTFSPSILGAILLILLSFYVNFKLGLGLGIIALIYFVSQYYYDLHFSLLTKSILLFISGIVFVILYLFTSKLLTNEKI